MNSYASSDNSSAFGEAATATGVNSIANGFFSTASATNSTAIGANSVASANNSVALGAGSLANQQNTVSVGNAGTGLTRRITNVAPGVASTDAANVGQLTSSSQTAGVMVGAAANASMGLMGLPGATRVALGTSVMGDQVGMALAVQRSFDSWAASLSTSTDGNLDYMQVGGSVGISF
jgi:hypothetical protein